MEESEVGRDRPTVNQQHASQPYMIGRFIRPLLSRWELSDVRKGEQVCLRALNSWLTAAIVSFRAGVRVGSARAYRHARANTTREWWLYVLRT